MLPDPDWILVDGGRLAAYGALEPDVVLVHGTPSWTFEFREVAAQLDRWAAVDHLGFGRSDKPSDGDYSLAAHQDRFSQAMASLDVRDAVFVLHDVGAAIALPWMLANPDRVRGVVLANTFLWPASGAIRWVIAFYASFLGRLMYLYLNFSARYLLPLAWGKRKPLDRALHAEYLAPFDRPAHRHGPAALPGELIGGTLVELEARVGELAQWPLRAVWGMRDPLVGATELARWKAALPQLQATELPDVGHFVAEEAPHAIAAAVEDLRTWTAHSQPRAS